VLCVTAGAPRGWTFIPGCGAYRRDRSPTPHRRRRCDAQRITAFQWLADRRLDATYRLATAILRDDSWSHDAVHDAIVLAWQNWSSLRDRTKSDVWFDRIVVNVCRNRLRGADGGRTADISVAASLGTPMGRPRSIAASRSSRCSASSRPMTSSSSRWPTSWTSRSRTSAPSSMFPPRPRSPAPLGADAASCRARTSGPTAGATMNDQELDKALRAIGVRHVRQTAPAAVRELAMVIPSSTPERRRWLPWRSQVVFNAAKFVVAGAIVAMVGGFLVTEVLPTRVDGPSAPAAVTAAAASPAASVSRIPWRRRPRVPMRSSGPTCCPA
jgi:hypothetical protein